MIKNSIGKALGIVADEADKKPVLGADLAIDLKFNVHHSDHVERFPQGRTADAIKVTQRPIASRLDSPVATLDSLEEIRGDTRVVFGVGIDEGFFSLLGQRAIIALKG